MINLYILIRFLTTYYLLEQTYRIGVFIIIRIVPKPEYLKQRKTRQVIQTTVTTTDSILDVVATNVPGKTGKAARLLRELLRIVSGQ